MSIQSIQNYLYKLSGKRLSGKVIVRETSVTLHYHSPKLHPGPCNSVGMRPRTDTQTNT